MKIWLTSALAAITMALSALPAHAQTAQSLFAPDTLFVQVAYVEKTVGPAWKVQGDHRQYKLGPCVVTLIAQKGEVIGMEMDVNAQCNPDLQNFVGVAGPLRVAGKTFGDIAAIVPNNEYAADCLTMCGNAYDPSLYMILRGAHFNDFIDVAVSAAQVDKRTIEAGAQWATAMEKAKGEEYVMGTDFNCDRSKDAAAQVILAPARITHIQAGQQLDPTGCAAAHP